MDLLNLSDYGDLSGLPVEIKSQYARSCLLLLQQNRFEVSSELQQNLIQIRKATRLKSGLDPASEDWQTWESIEQNARNLIPILQTRLVLIDHQINVMQDIVDVLGEHDPQPNIRDYFFKSFGVRHIE